MKQLDKGQMRLEHKSLMLEKVLSKMIPSGPVWWHEKKLKIPTKDDQLIQLRMDSIVQESHKEKKAMWESIYIVSGQVIKLRG